MTIDRTIGIKVLSAILSKKKNIDIIEKYIFQAVETQEQYCKLLYEICAILYKSGKNKIDIEKILNNIFYGRTGWNNDVYTQYRQQIEEEDKFITEPFEIEEGVLECKCGSKRTISYQKQTRAADEGSTTFAQCVECGTKWRQ